MQSHEGSGITSLGRSQNDSGIIQRKLQRAYQEKELLLGEVQSLRQQLRSMKEQQKSKPAQVGVPPENIDGWNHLLEANMKSGTMACVWCIKTHYVKLIASAFSQWKCFSACAYALSKAGPIDSNHTMMNQRTDAVRMKRLLSSAQKVLTSSRGGGDSSLPNFMKHRTRSANSSPVASHPYQGSSAFEHSLRRRSLSPGRRLNERESRVVAKATSPPKRMPSYSTPTYSSLKMFNQGSPTVSFRHPNRSAAYMAYLNSKGENGYNVSMANSSPPSLRTTENVMHVVPQKAIATTHENRTTSAHIDFADDVSEISSDNDEVPSISGMPRNKRGNRISSSERKKAEKKVSPSQSANLISQNGIRNDLTRSYAMPTRPGNHGPPNRTEMSTKNTSRRRPVSAKTTGKASMDKAQMRLLYGSVDDAPGPGLEWSNKLREEPNKSARLGARTPGESNRRRSSFRFKL